MNYRNRKGTKTKGHAAFQFSQSTTNSEDNTQISVHRSRPSLTYTSAFPSRFCSGLDFSLDYRLATFVCSFPPRLPVHPAPSACIHLMAPLRLPVSWLLYSKKVAFQREICRCHPPLAEEKPWQRDTPSPSSSPHWGTHHGLPLPRGWSLRPQAALGLSPPHPHSLRHQITSLPLSTVPPTASRQPRG